MNSTLKQNNLNQTYCKNFRARIPYNNNNKPNKLEMLKIKDNISVENQWIANLE